ERWLSGELAKLYPDRVLPKKDAWKTHGIMKKHVFPHVRHVPVTKFTLEHADGVMAALPENHAQGSRQQIAMTISHVMALCASPLKLILVSPIPRGWIPKRGASKAFGYIYPDEDAQLLRCEKVPLCYRIYYGFLDREGMRSAEAEALLWSEVDLDRGAVML